MFVERSRSKTKKEMGREREKDFSVAEGVLERVILHVNGVAVLR